MLLEREVSPGQTWLFGGFGRFLFASGELDSANDCRNRVWSQICIVSASIIGMYPTGPTK